MTYAGKIRKIEKFILQADNQTYLDVEVEVLKDGEIAEIRKLGFPLDTGSEEVEAQVKKFIETYANDQALAEQNKKVEVAHKKADEAIASLTGKEIN